jgi:hypothetical protein
MSLISSNTLHFGNFKNDQYLEKIWKFQATVLYKVRLFRIISRIIFPKYNSFIFILKYILEMNPVISNNLIFPKFRKINRNF